MFARVFEGNMVRLETKGFERSEPGDGVRHVWGIFLVVLHLMVAFQATGETRFEFQLLGAFPSDGPVIPIGGLLQTSDGTLYGTTKDGEGYGSVFKVTTNGQLNVLIGFDGPKSVSEKA